VKKSALVSAAALACALLAPAGALAAAAAPKLSSDLIVPNQSLGGITLNAPAATAKKFFPGSDCTAGGCTYQAPDASWTLSAMFGSTTRNGKPKIIEVTLFASTASGSVPASLPDVKTAAGIGIGSTVAQLKKAYPKLLGSGAEGLYTSLKPLATDYHVADGHVSEITIHSANLG
jgi:hypothetical protein